MSDNPTPEKKTAEERQTERLNALPWQPWRPGDLAMPSFASKASERGCTCPVGWLPALMAFQPAGAKWLKVASPRMERQELPVQRKSTFIVFSIVG